MINKNEIIGETIANIMSQTSVTSVTSTDQGQIILPERQGAYKRRQLDGFDTWIYDKKTNEGYTEDNIKFLTFIHNDIYIEFKDKINFEYFGSVSLKVSGHRFVVLSKIKLRLTKHLKTIIEFQFCLM